MSENWQAGDIALCIEERGYDVPAPNLNPRKGRFYTVKHTTPNPVDPDILGLAFTVAPTVAFNSKYFRKVTPPAADEFDRETIALMRGAPAKVPA